MSSKLTYRDAGVDTREGERAVSLMKDHVRRTFNDNVLTGLGGFGGLYRLPLEGLREPVLVSGTDGVGTKLKVAFMMDRHDTVGIDCVAMCVNDVLCQGAQPLFFLDYIATGKVTAEKIADIVKGVAAGCAEGESALIGGETAEMPGFYGPGEYDMAGFSVGVADRSALITGERIAAGDVIIGLPSSGLHSNGYSLVRRIVFDQQHLQVGDHVEALGETLGEALLRPTRIYAAACRAVRGQFDIKGIVHVTGGGFYENVPRILPDGIAARFDAGAWQVPPIFPFLQECGGIETREMYATFNMGIGMMLFAAPSEADDVIAALRAAGEEAVIIGETAAAEREKVIINGTA
ncbi:MAG: phosphoribosylformylglycinamidine cyclo-ligase [Anaerovoracaceae bacterium]|jgi:phosphoribosylformylglycinamidine cyclo-ligase